MMKVGTDKGFSLVEVLIVLALIAAMASIGIPAMIGRMSHMRLRRDARSVFSELNAARLKAITMNTKYRVEFTVPDTYSLSVWDTAGSSWGDDATQAERSLSDGIGITSPGANFSVYFFPNGTATNADSPMAVDVEICLTNSSDTSDKMELEVDGATGKVSITSGC